MKANAFPAALSSVWYSFHLQRGGRMAISVQCGCGKRTAVSDALAAKKARRGDRWEEAGNQFERPMNRLSERAARTPAP
jgi:hypothetical protein